MCGLTGAIGPSAADKVDGARLLGHRGPDDAAQATGKGWWLGFRRLAILDLSSNGRQPMATLNGDAVIAFNGEIYNYLELRSDLENLGERFRGASDTEVLLALLRREGALALQKLNGMFAIVFLDLRDRSFLLARDRLGVKPLHFLRMPGEIRFASELKALLSAEDAPRQLDEEALAGYLGLGYVPGTGCIFRGYEKLGPGETLKGSLDEPERAERRTWWRSTIEPDARHESEAAEIGELADLLGDATRIRLRSDVPVGVFLSGGVDSGLVAALAAKVAPETALTALTVRWEDEECDESAAAKATARMVGLPQKTIVVRAAEAAMVDRIGWYFDEPFADASALPTFLLCEAARRQGTVFMGGDGGDEAFGGYRRYLGALKHSWAASLSGRAKPLLSRAVEFLPGLSPVAYRIRKLVLEDQGFAAAYDGIPNDPALAVALGRDREHWLPRTEAALWRIWGKSRGKDLLTRMQALDYALYLPDDILVKVDRASMANSIEVRSPFLDHRVVGFAARMPRSMLADGRLGKKPLRRLAGGVLPAEVATARKKGFGVPLDHWFRKPAALKWLRGRLLSPEAIRRGLWDGPGVERLLLHQARGRRRDLSVILWRLLVLDAWARWYLDSSAFRSGPPSSDYSLAGKAA